MARNEEKHFSKLNRWLLAKETEEKKIKRPKRPKLSTLTSVDQIQRWLPSIEQDIDFYLKKTEVPVYTDDHVKEYMNKVNSLQKEHNAFVRKLKHLTPSGAIVTSWNHRPYKRKNNTPPSNSSTTTDAKTPFVPISAPILDAEVPTIKVVAINIDLTHPREEALKNFSQLKDKLAKIKTQNGANQEALDHFFSNENVSVLDMIYPETDSPLDSSHGVLDKSTLSFYQSQKTAATSRTSSASGTALQFDQPLMGAPTSFSHPLMDAPLEFSWNKKDTPEEAAIKNQSSTVAQTNFNVTSSYEITKNRNFVLMDAPLDFCLSKDGDTCVTNQTEMLDAQPSTSGIEAKDLKVDSIKTNVLGLCYSSSDSEDGT